eukprot:scaffold4757_cov28-Tisochrysis_lutea.AAC.2
MYSRAASCDCLSTFSKMSAQSRMHWRSPVCSASCTPSWVSPARNVIFATPIAQARINCASAARASKREAIACAARSPAVYMLNAWSYSPLNSSCCANSHDMAGTCSGASVLASLRACSQCRRSRRISRAATGRIEPRKSSCARE